MPQPLDDDQFIVSEWKAPGILLCTIRGRTLPRPWTDPVITTGWTLTLVRRGGYRRRVDGVEHIVDTNTGFVRGPGQEVSTATFATDDELTCLELGAPVLHQLPDLTPMRGLIEVEPRVALAHRLMLRRLDGTTDALTIEEAVLGFVHQCLWRTHPHRRIGCRGSTAGASRRLVTDVVEVLNTSFSEPHGLRRPWPARRTSPYHLSRVFREVTGLTLSEYRTRLRVHAVLDRLELGDRDLAAVAAATGFADHGHMTRTVTGHLGAPPSVVRHRLARERGRNQQLARRST